MKQNFSKSKGLACKIACSVLLLAGTLCQAQSVPNSPVGDWDFIFSGSGQKGIAFLSFSASTPYSGTFTGPLLMVSNRKPASSRTGETGRQGEDGTDAVNTNLFGHTFISGIWAYDIKGSVIGNYVIDRGFTVDCHVETNIVDGTNFLSEICITNIVQDSISFNGKVHAGAKPGFSFVASTANGKLTFKGLPFLAVTNLAGLPWYGVKKQDKQNFIEFFTLGPATNTAALPFLPNAYKISGLGTTYAYDGLCLISRQNQIGFSFAEEGTASTNRQIRATVGSFRIKKGSVKAQTAGQIEPDPGTPITFDATLMPTPGP